MTTPLCGRPLRSAMRQARICAKPAGHRGKHLSAAAIKAARQRAATQPPTGSLVVAAVIRQARERAEMSRPRLAAVVGVSATAIQWWEEAKRTPGEEHWVQLELALGPLGVVRDPGRSDLQPGTGHFARHCPFASRRPSRAGDQWSAAQSSASGSPRPQAIGLPVFLWLGEGGGAGSFLAEGPVLPHFSTL